VSSPRLRVVEGDITLEDVDAVVNAANAALKRGGGVDGAIHHAAGPELQLELDRIGACPTGQCRLSAGYRLKARAVIHCVGPVWRGGGADEDALLAACYRNALSLAGQQGFRSLAFPAISTGIYGYPRERATLIAVAAVRAELARQPGIAEVRFVCFDAELADLYRRILGDD
jgi:O-acetyl-ADP-ribose deacetylase (regulator of RNase III)